MFFGLSPLKLVQRVIDFVYFSYKIVKNSKYAMFLLC